jgi:hypothetical protein
MTRPDPLVAARGDEPADAWSGVWIAEDIEQIATAVTDGSWVEGTLGVVSAGLDGLAFVSDPVGGLLQYGVAWLIEHVKPLSEALDWLAGDPAQISAHAQTWRNVAASLSDEADLLAHDARWDLPEWSGAAAEAYWKWSVEQELAVSGLARASDTMALVTEAAGGLIAAVRLMVRDAIATVVSRLIGYAGEVAGTLGLAMPLVAEQVATLCASWAARIGRWLRSLIASLRELAALTRRVGERIDEIKRILRRLHGRGPETSSAVGDGGLSGVHGGHSSRPGNQLDYERQQLWAEAAYDDIRANPDAEIVAANVRDVSRPDGSIGFTPEEIEQIRRHIFVEEHPLNDYDGGIVQRRYDASPDMAEAWLRLRRGRQRPEDVALLEHELAESRYYADHPGSTYEEAHAAANGVSNWQNQIPEPTREDYSEPWRSQWA